MIACMGGWCKIRGRCPHYNEAPRTNANSERLCIPGRDGMRVVDAALGRVVVFDVMAGKAMQSSEFGGSVHGR